MVQVQASGAVALFVARAAPPTALRADDDNRGRWPTSAAGWMASRWPSSSRPRVCPCWACRASGSGWTTVSRAHRGRARGAAPSQTLRAALEWSHGLLTRRSRWCSAASACSPAASRSKRPGGGADERIDTWTCSSTGRAGGQVAGRRRGRLGAALPAVGDDAPVRTRAAAESGETEAVLRRHAEHALELAETFDAETAGQGQAARALDQLDQERNNLLHALAWCDRTTTRPQRRSPAAGWCASLLLAFPGPASASGCCDAARTRPSPHCRATSTAARPWLRLADAALDAQGQLPRRGVTNCWRWRGHRLRARVAIANLHLATWRRSSVSGTPRLASKPRWARAPHGEPAPGGNALGGSPTCWVSAAGLTSRGATRRAAAAVSSCRAWLQPGGLHCSNQPIWRSPWAMPSAAQRCSLKAQPGCAVRIPPPEAGLVQPGRQPGVTARPGLSRCNDRFDNTLSGR